jgi:hypothetical protein
MPKFKVKTTVTYEFDVEAKDYAQAILLGNNWDEFQWNREIEDIEVTEVEESFSNQDS